MLGARADGRRDLQRVGGGEHEHDVFGRFLEGLQQRRFRAAAEHVHFVEDVDLLGAAGAEVCDPFEQVADLLDLALRRRVDLDHVERRALGDRHAAVAHATRVAVVAPVGAVQGLGQQAGGGGLAGAPRAGEEVRVADPAVADGVVQGGASRAPARPAPRTAADGTCGTATDRPSLRSIPLRRPSRAAGPALHVHGADCSDREQLETLERFAGNARVTWEAPGSVRFPMLQRLARTIVPPPPVGPRRMDRSADRHVRAREQPRRRVQDRVQAARHREPGRRSTCSRSRASATARSRRRSCSRPTRASTTWRSSRRWSSCSPRSSRRSRTSTSRARTPPRARGRSRATERSRTRS